MHKQTLFVLLLGMAFIVACTGRPNASSRKGPTVTPGVQAPAAESRQSPPSTVVQERYRLRIPPLPSSSDSAANEKKFPMLVLIHGCAQDAEVMEKGSRMNAEADRVGFFVLYPQQAKGRNPYNCWRWFDPDNRAANRGELAEILGMMDEVMARYPIDPKRVFVAGLSSGGATAAALMACHPDRFQGAALHSSPAFDVASNELAALTVMRYGPAPFQNPLGSKCKPALHHQRLLVIHGTDDDVVHPLHAERLMSQFSVNGSQAQSWTLNLSQNGERESDVKCYSRSDSDSQSCLIRVNGEKHAWSGGIEQDFFDPKAFSASELISKFLIEGEMPFKAPGVVPANSAQGLNQHRGRKPIVSRPSTQASEAGF